MIKNNHKVLIVDDEIQAGRLIAGILKQISVGSIYSASGAKALYKMKKTSTPFSLIICDQHMPGMKGTEFLEKAAGISPDTVRFLMTEYSDLKAIVDAVNKGKIHKYITKPWNNEAFIEDIKAGLEQYELSLENERLFTLAKEQNSKLFQLNQDLKQTAEKQTETLSNLESQIEESLIKDSLIEEEQHDTKSLEKKKEITDTALMEKNLRQGFRDILQEQGMLDKDNLNHLLAAATNEMFGRFRKIGLKNGFELSLFAEHSTNME